MTASVSQDRDGEFIYDPFGAMRMFSRGRINWYGRDPDWKDVLGFRGKEDVESPEREWTRLEVTCRKDEITNVVNGRIVNVGTNATFSAGRIMIQSEGAEIYLRRIDLEPLKQQD
jgi:hypothetical protein